MEIDFEPLSVDADDENYPSLRVFLDLNKRRKGVKLGGRLVCIGAFGFSSNIEEKEKFQHLLGNGFAMIYSLLRGIVYQKASSLRPQERLLPTLNLTEIVKRKIQQYKEKNEE